MDNPITSIKSVILPTQITDVVVNSKGFFIKVDRVGNGWESEV